MTRIVGASLCASLAMACGPEATNEPEPPGVLEYEHSYARIHRLDRRVDIIHVQRDAERYECGILTERAYTELEDTLSVLDPQEDYGYDPETQDCEIAPGAWVHIEGFAHSPFACAWYCCRPELSRAALIYSLVESGFDGGGVNVEGEPYVALVPDEPCS